MAGLFCSIDFVKCVLNCRNSCHRLFLLQKQDQRHLKRFLNSSRRCFRSDTKGTIVHPTSTIFKQLVFNNFHHNSNTFNSFIFKRFSGLRYLSSKSSDTPDGLKNETNKPTNTNNYSKTHTETTNETINIKSALNQENAKDTTSREEMHAERKVEGKNLNDDIINKIGFETSVASRVVYRVLNLHAIHTSEDLHPPPSDDSDVAVKEKEIVMKVDVQGQKRVKTDFSKIYTENIFVPLSRAMPEYLLESSELESVSKYTRRSPYPKRDNITVFKKKHLEKRAIDKWGSLENLQLQKDFLRARQEKLNKQMFSMRQEMYSYLEDKQSPYSIEKPYLYQPQEEFKESSFHNVPSAKVVLFAIACNSLNCVMKLVAWLYTGSHSMFAEVIHSAADTINQVILAIGIKQSLKEPDSSHPYGWAKFRNVSSLISGVGIFCVGSGLSFYHGVTGLLYPTEPTCMNWALATLGASFIFEGGTLLVALNELNKGSKKANIPFKEYLTRGIDPTTTVVLMEDAAAVLGIVIASTAISITQVTGSVVPDAIGSLLIGTLLGTVASFIIYTNTAALVGRSIPAEKRLALVTELESDRMIRTLIDVKATEAGGRFVRFKAEVDFDGREVTRSYLETLNINDLYQEMKAVQSVEDTEAFMLKHGENVIDALGSAVDRIETNLKKKHPEIRHCDLEQL